MKAKFLTDCGRIRDHNEDAGGVFYNKTGDLLAVIADGMGGHQAGDVASELAVNTIKEYWEMQEKIINIEDAEKWIDNIINDVNDIIYQQSQKHKHLHGMGTTVVLSICTNDFVTVGHIGDSRCYVFNNNGLKQVTEDHSLVNELLRTGQITLEDAFYHPRKNVVLKALGTEKEVSADIQSIEWKKGNRLLLCSDGLTDKITNDELADFIDDGHDLHVACEQLIQEANHRGGEDNISLIMVDYVKRKKKEGETSC